MGSCHEAKRRADDDAFNLFYSEGGTILQWDAMSDKDRDEYRKRAKHS